MLTLALALAFVCPQKIQVIAPTAHSTIAALSMRECGRLVLGPWRARIGRSGVSAHHVEGDGTTPLGTFAIGPKIYGVGRDPGVSLPYHRLTCGDWWNEDPSSSTYNSFRHVACGTDPPFGGASEPLWRDRVAYRAFAVIRYNAGPVVRGRGSGIFLHVTTGSPTNGCVSLAEPHLLELLRRLRPGANISIRTA